MDRWAKKGIAIFLLLLMFGTMFPFRLRSFLQWIWAALPIFILSIFLLLKEEPRSKVLKALKVLCAVYTILIFSLFGFMKWYSAQDLKEAPDYILVFGAEMTSDGVSPMLARRCDKAFELSEIYSDAEVIVSGWQGPGDASNEAEGMRDYLVAKGLSEGRIFVEPNASDTLENLRFSATEIGDGKVAMVSDDFHLFRIGLIAHFLKIEGSPVSCSNSGIRSLRFWFREVLAIAWSAVRGVILTK
ncbi:MAG: YdcF family protein [Oscillospiraceae bacterium]|nr:YdcF family protein [Oscillospiraceae bacterium]